MHDTSLTKKIVSAAASHVKSNGIPAGGTVPVKVAAWACPDPDHLNEDVQELWPENAPRLVIQPVEPRCVCQDCGAQFSPEVFRLACESCGSRRVALADAGEIEVESAEG